MTKSDKTTELAVFQEKLQTLNRDLNAVFPKVEEVSKTIESINEKLISRIEKLEIENALIGSKIESLRVDTTENKTKIGKLHDYKNYLMGIIALLVLLIGLIAKGIIVIKI